MAFLTILTEFMRCKIPKFEMGIPRDMPTVLSSPAFRAKVSRSLVVPPHTSSALKQRSRDTYVCTTMWVSASAVLCLRSFGVVVDLSLSPFLNSLTED